MTATILPFRQRHSTFHPELVLFEGRQRRQWAVVERGPDGIKQAWPVYAGRKSQAISMARIYREMATREREMQAAFERDPIGQMITTMTPETRETLWRMLQYFRLREQDSANAET